MNKLSHSFSKEVITLKAKVDGLADTERTIKNLSTVQVPTDNPSHSDVKDLGRPKEFSGKKGDFQQWSKKTEAFWAGVIKESETMLECSAEHITEITQELVDLEFLPTSPNVEQGVHNLKSLLRQIHKALVALTRCEENCCQTRGRTRWRHGEDCRNDMIRRPEEENEKLLRMIISLGRCSLLELQAGNRTLGVLRVSLREEDEG